MSLADIREGMATNLATISGIRVYEEVPDSPALPCAVIEIDRVNYNLASQRGLTEYTFTIHAIVVRTTERRAQRKLDLFIDDPTPILKIIENLKDDDSRFVQKSVANNLNDILKDNYGIGINIIRKWSREATPNRKWIIRHALRNQIKKGDAEAKKLLEQL